MKIINLAVIALIAIGLIACKGNEASEKVASLEGEIKSLRDKVSILSGQISTDIWEIKSKLDPYESAVFDPAASRSYGRVDSVGGIFLVSLENVEPYLDGVRVNIEIGNVQYATYAGFTITAKYGRRFPKFDKTLSAEERDKHFAAYTASEREKDVQFTESLRPATWNRVSMVLPDIKPVDFGKLEIKMQTNEVRLARTRAQ